MFTSVSIGTVWLLEGVRMIPGGLVQAGQLVVCAFVGQYPNHTLALTALN